MGWKNKIQFGWVNSSAPVVSPPTYTPAAVFHGYAVFRSVFIERLYFGDTFREARKKAAAAANQYPEHTAKGWIRQWDKDLVQYDFKDLDLEWFNDKTDVE